MPTQQRWIRDGGRVCLDFVNTLRDRWREPRETLGTPEDLARWLDGAGLVDAQVPLPDQETLDHARLLREAIDHVVLAAAQGGLPEQRPLARLNAACREALHRAPQLEIADGRLATAPRTARAADSRQTLGLLAEDAIALVVSAEVVRVRVCASDTCGLRFLDRSPARNRRWCSMTRCGNRLKARRHYARATG
jgi:predicted RNA-binding Zn ribbon-like protein